MLLRLRCPIAMTGLAFTLWVPLLKAATYDPLAVDPGKSRPAPLDLIVHDSARGRDVPLRVYLPSDRAPAPVILFSHGLGGSRAGSAFLGVHWAARGYAAVFVQHPGSDDSVWKDLPAAERLQSMNRLQWTIFFCG